MELTPVKLNIKPRTGWIITSFFFFLFLIIPDGFAMEKDRVGKVIAVRGNVLAIAPDTSTRKLTLKAPVFLHETIQTKQGRIQLMFDDRTLITLGRNSKMKITRYSWKPGDPDSAMETQVQEGSFRIMGGAITRIAPDNFKTDTPSGTIGIRGSMYAGLVQGALLRVIFQGGKGIYIVNGMGRVDITRSGFGTTVKDKATPPQKPKKITPKELQKLEQNFIISIDEDNTSTGTDTASTGPGDDSPDGDLIPLPLATDGSGTVMYSENIVSGITAEVSESVLTSLQAEQVNNAETAAEETNNTEQHILSLLTDLGVNEPQSLTVPSTGIWTYQGKMKNTLRDEPEENIKFIVNWDNRRIMAIEDIDMAMGTDMGMEDSISGFGFGDISSSGEITHIRILGSDSHFDGPNGAVMALTGSETFGHFYGDTAQGLGIAMEGYDINLRDETDQEFWSDIVAATVDSQMPNPFSGTTVWNGYFVGIAEDMASPDNNRRVFHNYDENDFTLSINKDTGTISGIMSGIDFNDNNNAITGLSIGGGTSDSVFISDDVLAATFTGSNAIISSGSSGGIKSYGNFMAATNKSALSGYTTWGYWELAYKDPVTGKDYHIHAPGSMWIAGELTSQTAVADLVNTSFYGTYTGKAEGVMVDIGDRMTNMTHGITSLDIDFNPYATQPVSGNITFDQINLFVTSNNGDVTVSGFQANIANAIQSQVQGSFFGPGAEGIGGNFSCKMQNGMQYHGIYAGDRLP